MLSKIKRKLEYKRITKIPRRTKFSTNILGSQIVANDSASFIAQYNEIFNTEIFKFEKRGLEKVKIIDCGSNIGLSVIYFKKLYPDAEIIAFEADPKIFELLKSNIKSFGIDNVKLINKAVWINNDGVLFRTDKSASGRIEFKNSSTTVRVESEDLSEYLNTEVSLLKLDIEGAETTVIPHIAPKLKRVQRLFFEYHKVAGTEDNLHKLLNGISSEFEEYFIATGNYSKSPFIKRKNIEGYDHLLNIFAVKSRKVS
jgi:FkbM family methyltransferase